MAHIAIHGSKISLVSVFTDPGSNSLPADLDQRFGLAPLLMWPSSNFIQAL